MKSYCQNFNEVKCSKILVESKCRGARVAIRVHVEVGMKKMKNRVHRLFVHEWIRNVTALERIRTYLLYVQSSFQYARDSGTNVSRKCEFLAILVVMISAIYHAPYLLSWWWFDYYPESISYQLDFESYCSVKGIEVHKLVEWEVVMNQMWKIGRPLASSILKGEHESRATATYSASLLPCYPLSMQK